MSHFLLIQLNLALSLLDAGWQKVYCQSFLDHPVSVLGA